MFEDATFDSRPHLPGKTPQRVFLALAVNLTILTALVVYPLLYPETLPTHLLRNILYIPPVPPAQAPPHAAQPASPTTTTISLRNPFEFPRQIPSTIHTDPGPAPESLDATTLTSLTGVNGSTGSTASTAVFAQPAPHVAPKAAAPKSTTISQGVAVGLLLFHPAPIYPIIARTTRLSGTVVLAATIDHEGKIANLRVVSGPPLLREAALTAVQQWRYRPYFLNNQPVDVETTINVVFTLGN